MTKWTLLLLSVLITGCGTVTSLSSSDEDIAYQLRKQKSYCETTSRAYGGVSYNLCKLNSNPNKTYIDWFLGFYIIDTVVSAAGDTVALPYSAFQQAEKGSIKVAL